MTVRDLIKKLQLFQPDQLVFLTYDETDRGQERTCYDEVIDVYEKDPPEPDSMPRKKHVVLSS
jgi:hypothetical protein